MGHDIQPVSDAGLLEVAAGLREAADEIAALVGAHQAVGECPASECVSAGAKLAVLFGELALGLALNARYFEHQVIVTMAAEEGDEDG